MPTTPAVHASVTTVLVSRDGARWLPTVLEGLRNQSVQPDRVIAVDAGSQDETPDLLREALGADSVLTAPGSMSFPASVSLALNAATDGAEWVWILHDDANPDPAALQELLAAADADPGADILGPKLREWPSLRRLLELGVTISGTGRRETGLERGEYDQGQHDEVRTVLAVNTAGMLVRRAVLEKLGGFDENLPIFGNDLDFGWRAASAGHRTIIVPQAVVFHAEAAHRGLRRTPLTGRHTHYAERRAALYTLLVNCRTRAIPFQVIRILVGTLLRVVGLLAVRSVGEARDELAALVSLYSHPGQIREARKTRRALQVADPAGVRRLLAPPWLPYRHGLDSVSDLAAAAANQAQDVAERRRAAKVQVETATPGPRRGAPVDDDTLLEDTGLMARLLTNPVAVAVLLFVVLALVAGREVLGPISGGALSPAPAGAGDWWRLHLESWHPLGQGTDVPAPAYVLPFSLLGTLLFGQAGLVFGLLLLLAVPFGLWGAWRFLRVVGHLVDPAGMPRWLVAWGAAAYSLVPVTSGAWGEGRFGSVAVAALLPWLAHATLGFADPDRERRWRAAWRTGLLLALGAAFAPGVWVTALLLALVIMGAGLAISPAGVRDRHVWGPPATALAVVPVLLAPWLVPVVLSGAWGALLLEAGRLPVAGIGGVDLLAGRIGADPAPLVPGLVLLMLGLVGLVFGSTRIAALVSWLVAALAAVAAGLLSGLTLSLATTETEPALGVFVVLIQAAAVVAAALGGMALAPHLIGGAVWRRTAAWGVVIVALTIPVGGLGWFLIGSDVLTRDEDSGIPAYMTQTSLADESAGVLVIQGTVDDGLTYLVRRGDGLTVGEDEILALSDEDEKFTETVTQVASRPSPEVMEALATGGIEYVVLPEPADGRVASVLDASAGLIQASAENRSTRAWQVASEPDPGAVSGPVSWLHIALLVIQGAALLVVAVLCGPSRKESR